MVFSAGEPDRNRSVDKGFVERSWSSGSKGGLRAALATAGLAVLLLTMSCRVASRPQSSPAAVASPSAVARQEAMGATATAETTVPTLFSQTEEGDASVPTSAAAGGGSAAAVAPAPTAAPAPPAATPLAGTVAPTPAPSDTSTPPPSSAPSPPAPATAPPTSPTVAPAPRTTQSWTERAGEFQNGQLAGVQLSSEGLRLIEQMGGTASSEGEYRSRIREAEFPFDNAVLSWNADAPEGSMTRFELRVRTADGWSNWYAMGEWRSSGGRSVPGQGDALGRVDIDTLKLNVPATAIQYRVRLSSSYGGTSPLVRQVSVVYSDLSKGLSGPALPTGVAAGRDLPVPGQSQLEQDPAVRGLICSATSLAMVLQYWGLNKSVSEVVQGVKDQTTGIFGDWPLNTAFAGANGFDARVDRFYSVEHLEQEIAAGRPVIISIAFGPGELSGSPISSTSGHLIVVRGFTPQGDVIVNDPIAPNSGAVRLIYKREQLGRIWLRNGGVVYLISPRSGALKAG